MDTKLQPKSGPLKPCLCKRPLKMQTYVQKTVDRYNYNHERPHQGRNMNGKTPSQVFFEGLLCDPPQEGQLAA